MFDTNSNISDSRATHEDFHVFISNVGFSIYKSQVMQGNWKPKETKQN